MAERIEVKEAGTLLKYLVTHLSSWHRNTLKDRLKGGCIRLNDEVCYQHNEELHAGDCIEIYGRGEGKGARRNTAGLITIYTDQDITVIDKPSGLLSVSSEREHARTALAILKKSLSGPGDTQKLWPVHRLDRETSGVLLFAHSKEVCDAIRANWSEANKVYLAIVSGHPDPADRVIDQPLWEDKNLRVHVGDRENSRAARTRFKTLQTTTELSLLEVTLDTGRRHQIRAHLAWLGHPIIGDERYGPPGPRLMLHARRLTIQHPNGGGDLVFEAPAPKGFTL